ncbi:hypothetical protein FVE85_1233 [Porphyridium purpureum]|uniref:Uncharacterized protein n=1 Tax=Porphyridium purpureum TaxID=35688 RepID=A0A5J4YGE0_PORPP|nr:hypothetical protein FVE85_9587 [Porphyridium purpureum]KAA8490312.1 hypothetical protein FVE85_1233 [Porphyridium purpureum]|eukprot:POR7398..scf218_34
MLSYNVAGFQRSAQAPPGWNAADSNAHLAGLIHAHPADSVHMQKVPDGGAQFHVDKHRAGDASVVSHHAHNVTCIRMESEEALVGPSDQFVKLQLPEQAGFEYGFGLALQLNLEERVLLVNVRLEPFKEGCNYATRRAVTDEPAAGTQGSELYLRGYEHAGACSSSS